MTTTARCVCCDLPVESCGKAVEARQRNEDRAERVRLVKTPGAFFAQWPSRCVGCGDLFSAGDPIVRDGIGYRSLICCEEPS